MNRASRLALAATVLTFSGSASAAVRRLHFEPDDLNFAYLEKNIAHHGITNVIPVRKALSGTTGTTTFFMDGTMASGIRDFVVYSDSKHNKEVPTISMEDACKEFGCVPSYVKMDIEGAELAFIDGAK